MSDHRKESRKKLIAFTPVYDSSKRVVLGYVGDLTTHGAMVIGERPVELNKEILLTIEFPKNLDNVFTTDIPVHGRVTWCRPDETGQHFNIGFEFTDAKPVHVQIFQAILERYQFHQTMPEAE